MVAIHSDQAQVLFIGQLQSLSEMTSRHKRTVCHIAGWQPAILPIVNRRYKMPAVLPKNSQGAGSGDPAYKL
jgi:hypothetical protein